MPTFFDPKNLTDDQKARWMGAVTEYLRVMERNRSAEQAIRQRAEPHIDQAMLDALMTASSQPGHPKSALFARLLSGKPALPLPPPTSYSYPWYSVVEEAGPFPVMLGHVCSMGWLRGAAGANGHRLLTINQCLWQVESKNAAAGRLIELDKQLKAAAPDRRWNAAFFEDVRQAYAAQPEFNVRHGQGMVYRLSIGTATSSCRRDYAESTIAGVSEQRLAHTASVFDTDNLQQNARITETLSLAKNPQVTLAEARAAAESLPMMQAIVNQQVAGLEAAMAEYAAHPTAHDWVRLEYDGWTLAKQPA